MPAAVADQANGRAIPLLQEEICFATVKEMTAGPPYKAV